MMKYFAICDETTCQFTKNFIFSYRIIDRITEFSFIIFFRFYTFYEAFYFVYSGLSSVIFSPLPIIYCILLSVCHFFSNKPMRARVQFLVGVLFLQLILLPFYSIYSFCDFFFFIYHVTNAEYQLYFL